MSWNRPTLQILSRSAAGSQGTGEAESQRQTVHCSGQKVHRYAAADASILREFVDKIYISEVYTPDENEPRIKVREIEDRL